MFEDFYGFREQPFKGTPSSQFLYASDTHRQALAALTYGIENELGFSGLFASPGLGKTTLLFRIMEMFRTEPTAFVFETRCSSTGLLRYILHDLGARIEENDPVVLHQLLAEIVVDTAKRGQRALLIIDEAQNLDSSALETVRLLSNLETARSKLIHIILCGQPELAERLSHPGMEQLKQRISIMSWLKPLTRSETASYVNHRLSVAGLTDGTLFSYSALKMIAEESAGVPREINRICFGALTVGCLRQRARIDKRIVEAAICDFDGELSASRHTLNVAAGSRPASEQPWVPLQSQMRDALLTTKSGEARTDPIGDQSAQDVSLQFSSNGKGLDWLEMLPCSDTPAHPRRNHSWDWSENSARILQFWRRWTSRSRDGGSVLEGLRRLPKRWIWRHQSQGDVSGRRRLRSSHAKHRFRQLIDTILERIAYE